MLKKLAQFTLFFSIGVVIFAFARSENHVSTYEETKPNALPKTLEEALLILGDEKLIHFIKEADPDSVRMGKEMVYFGQLKDESNEPISKYFVCTDCHNQVLESADPADESPEAVLEHSMANNIPFLPASTFYSMYNKRHWYNGDYDKKYGDLVAPTRDSLYNAIQLCATQCSQGREMEHWEIRAVLHYYKSLELQLSDLVFTAEEKEQLGDWIVNDKTAAIQLLKSKYNDTNPATFGTNKTPEAPGYEPNAKNGEYIFTMGCLHCHDPIKGITNFTMSNDPLTLRYLYRKKDKYNNMAVQHITRYGTYAMSGRKQYMPMYSFEKLSEKQMLDLLHYLKVGGYDN